jgi:biotin operon repressor
MQLAALHVRALKGAAISVLVLCQIDKHAHSQEYLERYSGYAHENISKAVLLLRDMGYLVQVGRYEWSLAAGALQLPLGSYLAEPEPEAEPERDETKIIDGETLDKPSTISFDNIAPNLSSSSSGSINTDNEEIPPLPQEKISCEKIAPNSEKVQILEILDHYGIREPARSRLAALPDISAELVEAHCRDSPNAGIAIYRIQHKWPVKKKKDISGDRYVGGEYADWIIH